MRIKWLARLLLPMMRSYSASRHPDFKIVKQEPVKGAPGFQTTEAVYLRRWWLVRRNDWLNVYLHQMIRDDDAVLHDHSYWSISLVLADGLRENHVENPELEQRFVGLTKTETIATMARSRYPKQGDLVVRSSRMAHQLCVLPGSDPWTIFITGPRVRDWGFWCPQGWKVWHKYTNVKQTAGLGTGTSGVGVGCGED